MSKMVKLLTMLVVVIQEASTAKLSNQADATASPIRKNAFTENVEADGATVSVNSSKPVRSEKEKTKVEIDAGGGIELSTANGHEETSTMMLAKQTKSTKIPIRKHSFKESVDPDGVIKARTGRGILDHFNSEDCYDALLAECAGHVSDISASSVFTVPKSCQLELIDLPEMRRSNCPSTQAVDVGEVAELYTFGAPGVTSESVENCRATGGDCFDGERVVLTNKSDGDPIADIVSALASARFLQHPRLDALEGKDYDPANSKKLSCGKENRYFPSWWDRTYKWADEQSVDIHTKYNSFADKYNETDPKTYVMWNLASAVNTGPEELYEWVVESVKDRAAKVNMNTVGMHLYDGDAVYLFQDPDDFSCYLSFRGSLGSDSACDWVNNILGALVLENFCGIPKTHQGFVNELNKLINHPSWQSEVMNKLPHCASVTAVGHSLGGALATLWAACVNRADPADNDFKKLEWTPSPEPKLLDSVTWPLSP